MRNNGAQELASAALSNDFTVGVTGLSNGETCLPGAQLDLSVTSNAKAAGGAGGETLVGLVAVDKSILLLGEANDITSTQVLADKAKATAPPRSYSSADRDVANVFKSAGVAIISSSTINVAKAPCPYCRNQGDDDDYGGGQPRAMMEMDDGMMDMAVQRAGAAPAAKAAATSQSDAPAAEKTRSFFPETWLWKQMTVKDGAPVTTKLTVPDTITSWVLGGVGISNKAGLGISGSQEVTVFKPFFLEMQLPFSVVRGEEFELVVVVYSYDATKGSSDVTVTLQENAPDLAAIGKLTKVCKAEANKPCSVSFFVKPQRLGSVKVNVKAQSSTQLDSASRDLLVTPEGVRREYTAATLLEPVAGADATFKIPLDIPTAAEGLVPGSAKLQLSVTADIMGPSIDGLERLVRMPTGCGEQNMLTFAPIISVRKYLDAVGGLTPKLEADTQRFMSSGYQRELTYRRSDFGFSAFGNSDPKSSLWLSAFVLRSFALTDKYVFVDAQVLQKTARWIVQQQDTSDGHFNTVGRVIHADMKGGVAGSAVALTAYVTLALIEGKHALEQAVAANPTTNDIPDSTLPQIKSAIVLMGTSIAQGTRYLEGHFQESSAYGSTLLAFVLKRAGSPKALDAKAKMLSKAVSAAGTMHWDTAADQNKKASASQSPAAPEPMWRRQYRQPSANVEATAYALLALTAFGEAKTTEAMGVAKWLMQSRKGNGGWQSTQDTVVALEALSGFAAAIMADQGDVTLAMTSIASAGTATTVDMELTKDNFGVVQRRDIGMLSTLASTAWPAFPAFDRAYACSKHAHDSKS